MALASGSDQFIHHRLVEHAAFAVKDHHLRLEAVRLHLGLIVLDDVVHDGADALRVLHQHSHLGCTLGEVVAVLLAQVAGDLLERLVDRRLVDLELHLRRLEMQRQRGLVADGFLERVAAHVALAILVRAERPESIAIRPIDRRAGKPEQKRIRQRLAHLAPEVAFLRAMRLVHHHDDV